GRFFTITGQRLPGMPATVQERREALHALHADTFPAPPPPTMDRANDASPSSPTTGTAGTSTLDDDTLLAHASAASKSGPQFRQLGRGIWRSDVVCYGSQSEADLALCGLLAFWTGGDPDQMDRLFRRSGLMREKWDELHGASRYGEQTIQTAIRGCLTVYSEQ